MVKHATAMEITEALERLIRDARAGRIQGVAVVVAGEGGAINCTIAGGAKISDLYLGCAMAQGHLMQLCNSIPVPVPARPEKPEVIEQRIGPGAEHE